MNTFWNCISSSFLDIVASPTFLSFIEKFPHQTRPPYSSPLKVCFKSTRSICPKRKCNLFFNRVRDYFAFTSAELQMCKVFWQLSTILLFRSLNFFCLFSPFIFLIWSKKSVQSNGKIINFQIIPEKNEISICIVLVDCSFLLTHFFLSFSVKFSAEE